MKLQHIAAAVALVAAGTANAAIDGGNVLLAGQTNSTVGAGNGSLVLIAYDNIGGTTTAGIFDLGITVNDLIGTTGNGSGVAASSLAGTKSGLSWNFNTNTLSVNGVASSAYGNNDWTAAWNTLLANSDAADLRFVVTAFDNLGTGANKRSIVTGEAGSAITFTPTTSSGLTQIAGGGLFDVFLPISNKGTIASAANGAYTFTAADGATTRANGYVMAADGFAQNWRNFNGMNGETSFAGSTALYVVDGAAKKFQLEGTLSLNAATGTLTLAVPEPTTYALLVSGLAVVGAVARRRRAA